MKKTKVVDNWMKINCTKIFFMSPFLEISIYWFELAEPSIMTVRGQWLINSTF